MPIVLHDIAMSAPPPARLASLQIGTPKAELHSCMVQTDRHKYSTLLYLASRPALRRCTLSNSEIPAA